MTKEYWFAKWKHNDIKFNQDEVNVYLQHYYSKLNLKECDPVFIPLCGKSIDMLWLLQKNHPIVGVELSPIACQSFFEENNLPYQLKTHNHFTIYYNSAITLYCGDFFELTKNLTGNIKAVYDRGGFIALPPKIQNRYVEHMITLLPAGSKVLMNTLDYDQQKAVGPPYSSPFATIKRLYEPHFNVDRLEHKPYDVPEHLKAKGLQTAVHEVYLMTKIF